MSLHAAILAVLAVFWLAAFGVWWFELSVLAETQSLMQRGPLNETKPDRGSING